MAEEQTQSPEPATSETLDDVYKTYNVEADAANFHPQPQQPQQQVQQPAPQQQTEQVPDPVLDPTGFGRWQSQQTQELRQSLRGLHGELSQMKQAAVRQSEETDIRNAVGQVKRSGFEADDDFIEVALGQKARQDPRFLQVYNNRSKNPVAWGKALSAVANEFKGKFSFKTDPQLAENVRAARQSTQTSLTSREARSDNPLEDAFSKAQSPREFEALWAQFSKHNTN